MRTSAMRCRASLAARSPPRDSRWRIFVKSEMPQGRPTAGRAMAARRRFAAARTCELTRRVSGRPFRHGSHSYHIAFRLACGQCNLRAVRPPKPTRCCSGRIRQQSRWRRLLANGASPTSAGMLPPTPRATVRHRQRLCGAAPAQRNATTGPRENSSALMGSPQEFGHSQNESRWRTGLDVPQ